MTLERISPEEALKLMQEKGYVYVDVRSVPEFEAGHPPGAYNVPLMHSGPGGMQPNPSFVDAMKATFPDNAKLILGCRSGGRSKRAADLLVAEGFTRIVDQRAGFEGATDPFGKLAEPGWRPKQLPIATEAEPGRSWEEVARALEGEPGEA